MQSGAREITLKSEMADFRENVLPVVLNCIVSAQGEERNFHNAIGVIVHNQVFNTPKSGSLQDFISNIHSYLSSSKDRVTGLIMLNQLVQQCNTEIFQQHSSAWIRLLLQILQGHATTLVHKAACQLTSQVLQFSQPFTDLSRDIVTTTIPQLVPLLLASNSEWRGAALSCITTCLQTFSGPMVTFKNKVENLVLNEIEGQCCPQEAISCLCHLVRCGGGGNQGNKHTENWAELCGKIIGSLEETLSVLFEGLETGPATERTGPVLGLKSLSVTTANRVIEHVHRWTVLSSCLQTLLGTEFPAVARIPVDDIIKLVCRCLSVNRKMLLSRPTAQRSSIALQLPIIHIGALKILKQLILTCRTLLVPYCHVVMGYLSQELLWTHWTETQGHNKPYSALRLHVYEVLSVWLRVMDGCSGFDHEEKTIIREILHDVAPEKDSLKIDQIPGTQSSDGPSMKKKRKGGNYEVSQGISSQRKIHKDANGKLVQGGLDALYCILTTAGCELERKSIQNIQEFTVRTVLLVQNSSIMPVPYSIPQCRTELYRVLQGLALTPHPTAPPVIQCAVSCFSVGQQDRSFEVSSFCLEASRTCEVLIYSRVPCLNGPVICDNPVFLGDNEPVRTLGANATVTNEPNVAPVRSTESQSEPVPSTGQNVSINSKDLCNRNDRTVDIYPVKDLPIVHSPVNDVIVSEAENNMNDVMEKSRQHGHFVMPYDQIRPSFQTTIPANLGIFYDATINAGNRDIVEINESSDSESDEKSKKRNRTEKNDDKIDGPSEPKYTKLKEFGEVNGTDVNNDANGDSIISNSMNNPINLDESSSDSSIHESEKSNEINSKTVSSKASKAPKPSTSKSDDVIAPDDDPSCEDAFNGIEEIENDTGRNGGEIEIEKMRIDYEVQDEKKEDAVEMGDPFITTDSQGNEDKLTAIPITDMDSDEELNMRKVLQIKSQTSSDNQDKEESPDVQMMLSTFVDADPDPE